MSKRSSVIGFLVGLVVGVTVVMQSSILLTTKHHFALSSNEHHAEQTRVKFLSHPSSGSHNQFVPEPTISMINLNNIRATNMHKEAKLHLEEEEKEEETSAVLEETSEKSQEKEEEELNKLESSATDSFAVVNSVEKVSHNDKSSDHLNSWFRSSVAHTWFRYLRGCFPLSQSCDMKLFWDTSNENSGPWNEIGEIYPRRDLVMWATPPPEDTTLHEVPVEWVSSGSDGVNLLKERQKQAREAKEIADQEKAQEMEGVGGSTSSEERLLLRYLTSHGCSEDQAHQLSQPYYSQVERVVKAIMMSGEHLSVEDEVLTWTVTDGYAYADVIADMYQMVQRYGIEKFMFVALDERSAATACQLNAPVVLLDEVSYPALRKHAADKNQETKAQVEEAKFGTSAKLASMYVDAFFLEMDCWMLKNPLPLFTTARVKVDHIVAASGLKESEYVKPDMVISVHQESFLDINAGIYFVRGNERTRRVFQNMLDYILANPDVWDQSLMSCLVKRESPHQYLSNHDGCDRKELETKDLTVTETSIIQSYNVFDPKVDKPKDESTSPIVDNSGKVVDQRFTFAVTGADVIVSAPFPFIFEHATMVHVLTDKPLTSAHGKKLVAKELGFWEGANCYYCVGTVTVGKGETYRKKYLALDGIITTDVGTRFHDQKALDAILLHMVAIALMTDRILVMPHAFDSQRTLFGWQMMDVSILTELGIEWREGNFFHNRRLQFDERGGFSMTQGLISGDSVRLRHMNHASQPSTSSTSKEGDLSRLPEISYRLPVGKNMELVSRWKHLWGALKHDQMASDADVLFLNFDERNPSGLDSLELQETHCFGVVDEGKSGPWGCRSEKDGVPQLLLDLLSVTRFCMTKSGAAPRNWPNKQGLTPGSDCFTALEREKRLKEREQRLAMESKLRAAKKKKEKEEAAKSPDI